MYKNNGSPDNKPVEKTRKKTPEKRSLVAAPGQLLYWNPRPGVGSAVFIHEWIYIYIYIYMYIIYIFIV